METSKSKPSKAGFSLIELMVVIAIIAVLAAIAVPAYKQYQIKAKINNALMITEELATGLKIAYSTHKVYPSSITLNGVNSTGWVNVGNGTQTGGIVGLMYSRSADGLGAVIGVSIGGLQGIPGYVDPAPSSAFSEHSIIYYSVRDSGDMLLTSCGIGGDSNDNTYAIPLEYLPSACQCAHSYWFGMTNTAC